MGSGSCEEEDIRLMATTTGTYDACASTDEQVVVPTESADHVRGEGPESDGDDDIDT